MRVQRKKIPVQVSTHVKWVLHPILLASVRRILAPPKFKLTIILESYEVQKSIVLAACATCVALVTGCPSNNNNNNSGPSPDSIQGKTINVVVSDGAAPFSTGGSYVFNLTSGDGHSGTYELQGSGGVQSNIGSYTWTKTGDNTASLLETEQSGTLVQNTLTFQTATSGTIHSSSSNVGGHQDGTFTLN